MITPEIAEAKKLNGTPFEGQTIKQTLDGPVRDIGRTRDGRILWSNGTCSSSSVAGKR